MTGFIAGFVTTSFTNDVSDGGGGGGGGTCAKEIALDASNDAANVKPVRLLIGL